MVFDSGAFNRSRTWTKLKYLRRLVRYQGNCFDARYLEQQDANHVSKRCPIEGLRTSVDSKIYSFERKISRILLYSGSLQALEVAQLLRDALQAIVLKALLDRGDSLIKHDVSIHRNWAPVPHALVEGGTSDFAIWVHRQRSGLGAVPGLVLS